MEKESPAATGVPILLIGSLIRHVMLVPESKGGNTPPMSGRPGNR